MWRRMVRNIALRGIQISDSLTLYVSHYLMMPLLTKLVFVEMFYTFPGSHSPIYIGRFVDSRLEL